MKHQTVEEVRTLADVQDQPARTMSSRERLERWAKLLEQEPDRLLATLYETEYQPMSVRDGMRVENSPISVAFGDPVLHGQGMKDDTYGEAKRFFGVSDHAMHNILCYCHFGETVSSRTSAQAIRRVLAARSHFGLFGRLRAQLPM